MCAVHLLTILLSKPATPATLVHTDTNTPCIDYAPSKKKGLDFLRQSCFAHASLRSKVLMQKKNILQTYTGDDPASLAGLPKRPAKTRAQELQLHTARNLHARAKGFMCSQKLSAAGGACPYLQRGSPLFLYARSSQDDTFIPSRRAALLSVLPQLNTKLHGQSLRVVRRDLEANLRAQCSDWPAGMSVSA